MRTIHLFYMVPQATRVPIMRMLSIGGLALFIAFCTLLKFLAYLSANVIIFDISASLLLWVSDT